MEVIKCDKCGKCFMPYEGQDICPHCKEVVTYVKDMGLPSWFTDIFKENNNA